MQNQTADIEWNDRGVPVSTKFDDPYFSLDNGVEETHHVYCLLYTSDAADE